MNGRSELVSVAVPDCDDVVRSAFSWELLWASRQKATWIGNISTSFSEITYYHDKRKPKSDVLSQRWHGTFSIFPYEWVALRRYNSICMHEVMCALSSNSQSTKAAMTMFRRKFSSPSPSTISVFHRHMTREIQNVAASRGREQSRRKKLEKNRFAIDMSPNPASRPPFTLSSPSNPSQSDINCFHV